VSGIAFILAIIVISFIAADVLALIFVGIASLFHYVGDRTRFAPFMSTHPS
jgi:hypothetical protein